MLQVAITIACIILPIASQTHNLQSRIEAQLHPRLGPVPSVAYAVTVNGETVASGAVSRTAGGAGDTDLYQIGSLTKSFVAVGILMLEDDGELTVQDRITDHLPEFPELRDRRIEDLLVHRSGIINYTEVLPWGSLRSPEDIVAAVRRQIPDWHGMPRNWSYSNTSYLLLGLIIDRKSKLSFGQFMEERIFDPLGMTRTRYRPVTPNLAYAGPAGAIESCSRDMAKWLNAISAGEVDGVNVESVVRGHGPSGLGAIQEGYGWRLRDSALGPKWGHAGLIPGFSSAMALYDTPEGSVGVVLLASSSQTVGMLEYLDQVAKEAILHSPPSAEILLHWIRLIQTGSVLQGPMTPAMKQAFLQQGPLLQSIANQGPVTAIQELAPANAPNGAVVQQFRVQFQSGARSTWQIGVDSAGTLRHLLMQFHQ